MESDTSDDGKRKRGDDLEDLFKKSKKTFRSPEKTNDMMTEMMKLMKELSADVRDIKLVQQTHTEDTKALRKEIMELRREQTEYKKEISKLTKENEKIRGEVNDLKRELNINNGKIEKLESENRKKNIVVQGLTINTEDRKLLKENMEKFIEEEIGVKTTIKSAHRLGRKTCLLELYSQENKIEVMQNKTKLRNRQGDKIFINDDLTREERDIGKKIRQKAKEEKINGKKVKMGFMKLIVDGQIWKWNRQENMLEKAGETADNTKN